MIFKIKIWNKVSLVLIKDVCWNHGEASNHVMVNLNGCFSFSLFPAFVLHWNHKVLVCMLMLVLSAMSHGIEWHRMAWYGMVGYEVCVCVAFVHVVWSLLVQICERLMWWPQNETMWIRTYMRHVYTHMQINQIHFANTVYKLKQCLLILRNLNGW